MLETTAMTLVALAVDAFIGEWLRGSHPVDWIARGIRRCEAWWNHDIALKRHRGVLGIGLVAGSFTHLMDREDNCA